MVQVCFNCKDSCVVISLRKQTTVTYIKIRILYRKCFQTKVTAIQREIYVDYIEAEKWSSLEDTMISISIYTKQYLIHTWIYKIEALNEM